MAMVLLVRKEERSRIIFLGSRRCVSLWRSPSCQTESKAFFYVEEDGSGGISKCVGCSEVSSEAVNVFVGFLVGEVCSLPLVELLCGREVVNEGPCQAFLSFPRQDRSEMGLMFPGSLGPFLAWGSSFQQRISTLEGSILYVVVCCRVGRVE